MSPTFTLPSIYPITDTSIAGIPHSEQVKGLAAGGARLIQLREKNAPAREFFDEAAAALKIAREFGALLIINDRVDIALAMGADGVHLGQDDLPPDQARTILGPDAIIGFSTHSVAQARAALAHPIDYIAIGPIFGTKTKKDHDAVVGFKGLRDVRDAIGDFPLAAIGGIDERSLTDVLAAGADSAAIIRAILTPSGEIATNMKDLIALAHGSSEN